ncbi:single-stranded-DNA-specific exonuclease RecJ [Rubidibacter lacunae KORDI 51-2]|uniref:Single-stranded-DNA-specific exonuclease RecJ n=1 Tax=Rubidibacter lacunae KORDI 51-2 TaxID=582515 RepID=U5DF62_9CHRO|nr:single-stranded-DNA-specific exonuclease RecJ [Rubidibacter lacunae]ERN43128.1 single-stranded-DNA-specific exonuclease RecJ [Rubidibacter lacunae KORDI 51-2]
MQDDWEILAADAVPEWFRDAVRGYAPDGRYLAALLWQRGIRDLDNLSGFLDPDCYVPTSPFAFGNEMEWAIARLQQARDDDERVAIWGDFDADGITATSVLWDGLGEFFAPRDRLSYLVPDRLRESHGLNSAGLDRLAAAGVTLVVTCDTGSTNLAEIDHARALGIDIIVTDHHALPAARTDVVAIVNPRYLPSDHPLHHLSGVAVAYKLVEALYERLPDVPQRPLEHLLDLVAIGLIADLVELKGDCRYLAQRGIDRLKTQAKTHDRPGVAHLLGLCQRVGDRATDISFGIGPRINAVSRIHGDASFCIELLTGRDPQHCRELATAAELANGRRRDLQTDLVKAVKAQLARVDLSTADAIVLADPQWHGGILGLVAGQIAQEYGRPTILLNVDETADPAIARGSARSVNNIDLYELVTSQAPLLRSFGGHPYAAGMSLLAENVPLFRDGLQQQLRQRLGATPTAPTVTADLAVTVAELGKDLFRELRWLEPCGMGNPAPKLLVRACWFEALWRTNYRDLKGGKTRYPRTTFELHDGSTDRGFPGIWWGHAVDELPTAERHDAIVELDYNSYSRRYEVRLLAVRPRSDGLGVRHDRHSWLLDWRDRSEDCERTTDEAVVLHDCPYDWRDLSTNARRARTHDRKLALAYSAPETRSPQATWEQLVGIAKFLCRTGTVARREQLRTKLDLGDRALDVGLHALESLGLTVEQTADAVAVSGQLQPCDDAEAAISQALEAIAEAQFRREFFCRAPVTTLADAVG